MALMSETASVVSPCPSPSSSTSVTLEHFAGVSILEPEAVVTRRHVVSTETVGESHGDFAILVAHPVGAVACCGVGTGISSGSACTAR